MTIEEARELIRSAASYPALVAAYSRFTKRLFGQIRVLESPEKYLTAHASVMNAQSTACKTIKRLADQVFRETGLPRKPQGKFRGMDGLDIERI